MAKRNRGEGWQHAKLSGHENEDLVMKLINENSEIQKRILQCANKIGKVCDVKDGGLHEAFIPSILGDKTKAKPDIRISTDQNEDINVSIKKRNAGQVYLITPERFIKGFESQYEKIPDEVKLAISLFWGSKEKEGQIDKIIERHAQNTRYYKYQDKRKRLVKSTLDQYDKKLSEALLSWFKNNIVNIFDFCFIRGLAKNKNDWADIIWYKNQLSGDGEEDCDTMFNLHELKNKIGEKKDWVTFGKRTGGSTIQLPFGFVQWHLNQIQFHHSLESLKRL